MTEYCVPAAAGEASFVEKRSEFLGHVRPVESEDEARAFVAEMKKKYYDARHNCWCYIIKDGPERYSDDGEPQDIVPGLSAGCRLRAGGRRSS